MKTNLTCLTVSLAAITLASASHTFVTPVGVTSSTSGSDLWPASNLIQGPGTGFDAADPHNKTLTAAAGNWVTADPGGFPSDYIAVAGAPILGFDLGADVDINSISTWGYDVGNTNGVSEFSLRFATDAEGTAGYGTSIIYNPTFTMLREDTAMQENPFGQTITARYVEFTATDNFFLAPGNIAPNNGGDRVGLGEVSFTIPEPSGTVLALLGLVTFGMRRQR